MSLILVVDDNADLRSVMSLGMRLEGHQVTEAHNGGEALRTVRDRRPDLILLDIMMPDMSGHDVARALHETPATSGIPIIFVSAKGDPQDRAAGLAMPQVVDYVCKPFVLPELTTRVSSALKRHCSPD